jgi:ABC-type amino acid transport substrate-binding protein
MTKLSTRTAIVATALLLGAAFGAPGKAAAETIKLTTQEWKPYQYMAGGQPEGIAVKAVKCVVEKMGHKAEISVLPWVRAQKDVADGAAAGFFAASKSADRDAFAVMSQAFIPQVWRWYTPADKPADVSSKATKVGVLAGSSMEKWLEENGYAAQKIQSSEALAKMLQSGRIEAVLANEIAFKEALTSSGIAESAFKATQHSDRPLGVYFSKTFLASHAGFLDAFNGQVNACK